MYYLYQFEIIFTNIYLSKFINYIFQGITLNFQLTLLTYIRFNII